MSHAATPSRPGTRLWLLQAERDRVLPAAMAYVYADPARIGPVPGAWDAVTDLVRDRAPQDRCLPLLGGRDRARAFLDFAARVALLPDPAGVLGLAGGPPARVTLDDPGLAFAHVVGIVRHACGAADRLDALDRLCAYAIGHLRADLTRWVVELVEGPHEIRLDPALPAMARCLDHVYPNLAQDRLDGAYAHRA